MFFVISSAGDESLSGCAQIKAEMETRKGLINQACQTNEINSVLPVKHDVLGNLIVDDKRKIIYCYIPKVACTTLKGLMIYTSETYIQRNGFPTNFYFNESVHYHLPYNKQNILGRYNESEIEFRLKNYFKFLFVRNPMERLVSVYRDKFIPTKKHDYAFMRRFAPAMADLFRNSTNSSVLETDFLKWPEFVWFLMWQEKTKKTYDEHWNTFQNLCYPCVVKYDFIGMLENADEEGKCILPRIHEKLQSFPGLNQTQMTSTNVQGGPNTQALVSSYFKELNVTQKEFLRRIYGLDCKMFNYDCNYYWEL